MIDKSYYYLKNSNLRRINLEEYIFNIEPISKDVHSIGDKTISIIEFEPTPEGDVVKICTDDHEAGISTEYSWIEYKYPGFVVLEQKLKTINLNGNNVMCDILTIEKKKFLRKLFYTKKVFFDISDFFHNPIEGYENFYKPDSDETEKVKPVFEILLKKNVDNKTLFEIHKITKESLKTLQENISNGKGIFMLSDKHHETSDNGSAQNRLIKYLYKNNIPFQKLKKNIQA